jgi:hypothetical protein
VNASHLGNGIVLIRGMLDANEIKECDVSLVENAITPQGFTAKNGKLYDTGGHEYDKDAGSFTHPIRYSENIDSINFTKMLTRKVYESVVGYCKIFPSVIECITEHKQLHYIKYPTNAAMGPHSDCAASYKNNSVEVVSSSAIDNTLSTSVVLNNDFEGGEFVFTLIGEELSLNAGDALIYPSNFVGSHEVREVKSGERWSFLSFFSHARTVFGGENDINQRNMWLSKFRDDVGIHDTKIANNFQKTVKVGQL